METTQTVYLSPNPTDHHSSVDTSRPFGSVKEAVAVFGERLLAGDLYSSPKPFYYNHTPSHNNNNIQDSAWKFSPSPQNPRKDYENQPGFLGTLKKLEAELEETKVELKMLKERESETEIALASLNAELHKNMSKLAEAEAAAAAKKAALGVATRSSTAGEERRRSELRKRVENSPTLAQILSIGEHEGYFGGTNERKMMKKKPIIPLVGDLFFKKKGSSNTLHNRLYASPQLYFN